MPVAALNHLLDELRDYVKDHITKVAIGTGTNAPTAADTALQTQVLEKAVSAALPGGTGEVTHKMRILVTEGNGNTFSEAGGKDASGDLEHRVTHSGVVKTNQYEIEWRIKTKVKNP